MTGGRELWTKRGEMPREDKFQGGSDSGSGHFDKDEENNDKENDDCMCVTVSQDARRVPRSCAYRLQARRQTCDWGWLGLAGCPLVLRNRKPWWCKKKGCSGMIRAEDKGNGGHPFQSLCRTVCLFLIHITRCQEEHFFRAAKWSHAKGVLMPFLQDTHSKHRHKKQSVQIWPGDLPSW